MKFLLDQDVYTATARFLSGLGHDVVPVAQIGLSQAQETYRILTHGTIGNSNHR